ncbi:MAG: beta-galactosidase [Armatimonadetes bacterium]|nr:beta-galactosidase [Armatimonadota bacterium]
MRRSEWTSLNGTWEFAETDDDKDVSWKGERPFPDKIIVPFCRESELSGLGRKGFVRNVWYRRTFRRPTSWKAPRTLLHIGACDWKSEVWVNGKLVAEHTGGQSPIDSDVTDALHEGDNTLVIHAFDDTRSGLQALGKQCPEPNSYGCLYTRTTGIWQSVWMEGVGSTYIKGLRVTQSNPDAKFIGLEVATSEPVGSLRIVAGVTQDGKVAGSYSHFPDGGPNLIAITVRKPKPWAPGHPNLYDVDLSLKDSAGKVIDSLSTYVAFRDVRIKGRAILLNGKPVFQRLILDQGFYPKGVWTAPSDAALKHDIEMSMAAGFNGARLHQKVFEPRFLYWADKLGYMVWGEFPNWGLNYKDTRIEGPVRNEWEAIVRRDMNHPAIVGWCPFNETPGEAGSIQNQVVDLTRKLDPSRPIIDTSGYVHSAKTPMVLDAHDYDQNPVTFKKRWTSFFGSNALPARYSNGPAPTVPFMVSEYGGIGWDTTGGWGYGDGPKTLAQYYARFKGLTDALVDNPDMFGFCYTQLTDVEQERNGIYKYDRTPKFDLARLHAIVSRTAAIEKGVKSPPQPATAPWRVLVGSTRDMPQTAWKSTTSRPSALWMKPDFADASWYVSPGGFGQKGGWEKESVTTWNTPDIWLRQDFKWDNRPFKEAAMAIHYDNATEVYVNGQVVWQSARGAWNDAYEKIVVTAALKKALRRGHNVIAVHCHQDTGGQFIDLALLVR